MAVEPPLHEFALVLGAVWKSHDPGPVGQTLLELPVVGGAIRPLQVTHSTLDAVLVKIPDEEAAVIVGVRAALPWERVEMGKLT